MIWRWDQKQLVRYTSDNDSFIITEKEKKLILAYREREQLQSVIDKILDLSGETGKGIIAAMIAKK